MYPYVPQRHWKIQQEKRKGLFQHPLFQNPMHCHEKISYMKARITGEQRNAGSISQTKMLHIFIYVKKAALEKINSEELQIGNML